MNQAPAQGAGDSGPRARRAPRSVALDAFRGLTIAAMILVNNPGSWTQVYAPLRHADWHGWTPTDLVFPFFLFIVGAAIPLAFTPRLAAGRSRAQIVRQAARRSALLVLIGLFLHAFPFREGWFGTLRIPGVLQRIGVCYLLAALVVLWLRPRAQVVVCAACLLGYWVAIATGGGIDDKAGNLAARIDRFLLAGHLWRQGQGHDPEGLLSTIPALATTLLGVFAGRILLADEDPRHKVARVLVRGSLLIVVGYAWSWLLPINKPIWTSSYAVFTGGQATCALGLCLWFVDVRGWRRSAQPFVVYGVNALTVFVGSALLARTLRELGASRWLHENLLASWLPGKPASLAYALLWILLWHAVLKVMYARGWVWKL
jgi:predicted acyltransferase